MARTILLVEDDPAVRESVGECLRLEGYEVRSAANGAEGLAALSRAPRPALIVLDLVMPVMDGAQFVDRLRADRAVADIPVVLMTAAAPMAEDPPPPADGYLAKPFEIADLLAVVRRHCGPGAAALASPPGG